MTTDGRPEPRSGRRSTRLAVLCAAAAAYAAGAWFVPPGFFDGLAPPEPYHWVSPPPDLKGGNHPPTSGRATVAVQNGAAAAGHLYTTDQQASIAYPAQSFQAPPSGSSIAVEIQPVSSYPDLAGIAPAGNVYRITSSTPLISPIVVTLRYGSQRANAPTDIFESAGPGSPWRPVRSVASAVPYTASGSAQSLGYFVIGYSPAPASSPAAGARAGGGGPPMVALVAAGAIALAVLAGLPLLIASRRAPAAPEPEEQPAATATLNLGGARRRRRRRR